jgi:hypothetical protein
VRLSLFDLLVMASVLVVCGAVLAALRRPERRLRYGFIALAVIAVLVSGVWFLATNLRGY